ncbi:MAG: hypothetical protein KatS3mg009_0651 [Acidimicrobiia bacterium]|nr:MAG: hypothetical protein KatS3mg009_0651 [Acidimicrobiia bacterium]
MTDPVLGDGVAQGTGHVLLPDELLEAARPVRSIEARHDRAAYRRGYPGDGPLARRRVRRDDRP